MAVGGSGYLRTILAALEVAKPLVAQHPVPPTPPAPYVVIRKAAELTGYSVRAIEQKIAKGVWLKGREWITAPDGRRLIDMSAYARWVERGRAG